MKIIGLTGGIGSGKSTVAQYLRDEGIPVIDADDTGHRLLEEDPSVQHAVLDAFGAEVMGNGTLSRQKLADRIFADDAARKRLNALLHPAIIQSVKAQCMDLYQRGHKVIVVEAALMGEGVVKESWLSGLILVLAGEDQRVMRLARYRDMNETEARRRMKVQTSPERKRALADWIITNDGSMKALRRKAALLARELQCLDD